MTTRITTENITDATIGTADLASSVPLNTQWQAVVTASTLTAVAGRGYFIDTTSNTCTVTLPGSPSAGDVVVLKDYARNWGTNAVTIASALTDGSTGANTFSTAGQTVTLVYMDGTKGWSLINEDTTSLLGPKFITATGGTITTVDTDYKVHTFTGDGCFVVSCAGNPSGSDTVDYMVVAGGGGGGGATAGASGAGGGGAGGFRESSGVASGSYSASPLGACVSALPLSETSYPITVGGGGSTTPAPGLASNGSNSIFSTITSAGGGGSGSKNVQSSAGGSGAGGAADTYPCGAAGNTPPTSPPQGQPGGPKGGDNGGGGGGGGATGGTASPYNGATGGNGVTTSINTSSVTRAGGGGGGAFSGAGGSGGSGGGGAGSADVNSTPGTVNTGGGGGGAGSGPGQPTVCGANGGSGIVIIRYKFQ